jgi:hypothetical protein
MSRFEIQLNLCQQYMWQTTTKYKQSANLDLEINHPLLAKVLEGALFDIRNWYHCVDNKIRQFFCLQSILW